jgi:hypothetical protein
MQNILRFLEWKSSAASNVLDLAPQWSTLFSAFPDAQDEYFTFGYFKKIYDFQDHSIHQDMLKMKKAGAKSGTSLANKYQKLSQVTIKILNLGLIFGCRPAATCLDMKARLPQNSQIPFNRCRADIQGSCEVHYRRCSP